MDIATLKTIITSHIASGATRTLTLSGGDLGAEITQLFDAHLEDGTLRITNITRTPAETPDSITVVGQGGGALFAGAAVEARFSILNETPAVYLKATPGAGWSLATSFPKLSTTFLAELSFAKPSLSLASYAVSDTVPGGLSFGGVLKLTSVLGDIAWLLGDRGEIELRGTISRHDGATELALAAAPITGLELGFFELPSLTFVLRGATTPAHDGQPESTSAAIDFETSIALGDAGATLPLRATYQIYPKLIMFEADLKDAFQAALGEFSGLAGGVDLAEALPESLPINVVQLAGFQFELDVETRWLASVSIELTSAQPWSIIDDVISIEAVRLAFKLDSPMTEKRLSLRVAGEFGIGAG